MADLTKDPVFSRFSLWRGRVASGQVVNFVGQMIDISFSKGWDLPERLHERYDETTYPMISEEIFEWRLLLSAVLDARERFTMIECGAGYGRWLVSGACALRQISPSKPLRLVAIEGDPTHFSWIAKHFLDNDIDPNKHRLIHGAVDASDGQVNFWHGGDPTAWYGQMVVKDESETHPLHGSVISTVPSYSIETLLRDLDYVDLMDFDIQGAEARAITAGISAMTRKVKRVFVETHGVDIHAAVAECFTRHGWLCEAKHGFLNGEAISEEPTEYGSVRFQGGLQCWVNPQI